MEKSGEEFIRRSGHRFNLIIRALPTTENSAISFDELFEKVKKLGYKENPDQFLIDLSALIKRKEIGEVSREGKVHYWAFPRGMKELRKRQLLIRLHNMDLSDEDLDALEKIAKKSK